MNVCGQGRPRTNSRRAENKKFRLAISARVSFLPLVTTALCRLDFLPMAIIPRAAFSARLLAVTRQNVPLCRRIHSSPLRAAVAHPITAHGPPPKAPAPAPEFTETAETQTATELTKDGRDVSQLKKPVVLKKRFWKDVHVHGKPGMCMTKTGRCYSHGRQ
jgi:hypothetical protein